MPITAAGLAALLVAGASLITAWSLAWAHGLGRFRPTVPDVQLLPAPVGGHPSGDAPWFLVVGDSISAGITPETLGRGPNPSWVAGLTQRLAASRHAWRPDDLACPTESTLTYATGCHLAFTNPLLGGRAQRTVALADIAAHRPSLRFMAVELGANDLLSMRAAGPSLRATGFVREADAAIERLQAIVAELQHAAPGVPLFVADIYDPYAGGVDPHASQIEYFNLRVGTLAAAAGAHLIDFAGAMAPGGRTTRARMCRLVECQGDGLHPTPRGGTVLGAAAFQAIRDAGLLGPSL